MTRMKHVPRALGIQWRQLHRLDLQRQINNICSPLHTAPPSFRSASNFADHVFHHCPTCTDSDKKSNRRRMCEANPTPSTVPRNPSFSISIVWLVMPSRPSYSLCYSYICKRRGSFSNQTQSSLNTPPGTLQPR